MVGGQVLQPVKELQGLLSVPRLGELLEHGCQAPGILVVEPAASSTNENVQHTQLCLAQQMQQRSAWQLHSHLLCLLLSQQAMLIKLAWVSNFSTGGAGCL